MLLTQTGIIFRANAALHTNRVYGEYGPVPINFHSNFTFHQLCVRTQRDFLTKLGKLWLVPALIVFNFMVP